MGVELRKEPAIANTLYLYDRSSHRREHGAIARAGLSQRALVVKVKSGMGYQVIGDGLTSEDFAAIGAWFQEQATLLAQEQTRAREERVDKVMEHVAELSRDEQMLLADKLMATFSRQGDTYVPPASRS